MGVYTRELYCRSAKRVVACFELSEYIHTLSFLFTLTDGNTEELALIVYYLNKVLTVLLFSDASMRQVLYLLLSSLWKFNITKVKV